MSCSLPFKALLVLACLPFCALTRAQTPPAAAPSTEIPLATGWEFTRTDLGGLWEAWRGQKISASPAWEPVSLPHCFNALDAVDPENSYYQGPGWYRTRLSLANPYPGGRTLLFFEGAGQKTDVYVYLDKVGSHLGGYDQFTVDITDAVAKYLENPMPNPDAAGNAEGDSNTKAKTVSKTGTGKSATSSKPKTKSKTGTKPKAKNAKKSPSTSSTSAPAASGAPLIPIAIRCDNSRDLELIPSQLSDFGLYGGLYRGVSLRYVPAVSIERLHITPTVSAKSGKVAVAVRLYTNYVLHVSARLSLAPKLLAAP
jgi:beta-galactosidase